MKESIWNRGKGLGGTSNINAMAHLRGHPEDYNNWASITGDNKWSYDELLPFFLKSENYCIDCNENVDESVVLGKYTHSLLLMRKQKQYMCNVFIVFEVI